MPEPIRPAASLHDDERTVVIRRGTPGVFAPGTVLGHTYRIEALLARGGMGEVYRARHIELETVHAVKVILPSLANDPKVSRLLVEEARKLGRVRNEAIVNYEGLFRGEGDLRYLVMEYIEGESLTKILMRRRLEPEEVLRLRNRLAQGLAAAHDRGIIHRDLSPDNIILPEGDVDRAKLIDFGIAKSANPGDATVIGSVFAGRFTYASPEQVGLFGGHVDARSDVYGLGLVLAAAAIGFGKSLEMGSSPATVIAARQRVPDLSAVPATLRPVLEPMLQPRPEDRPASMRQLLEGPKAEPAAAPPVAASPRVSANWRRLGLIAAGVAVVIGGVVIAARLHVPAPQSQPTDELQRRLAAATTGYQCAALDFAVSPDRSVRVSGHLATAQELDRLRRDVNAIKGVGPVTFDVGLMSWPYCEVATVLNPLMSGSANEGPTLNLTGKELHIGDRLTVDIRGPAFDGYLYVDYFDTEGEVLHLFPSGRDRLNLRPLRNHFVLGCPPMLTTYTLTGKPGRELISLVATAKPLFPDPRPGVEQARDYLPNLAEAIGHAQSGKTAGAMLFFDLREATGATGPAAACPSS
ncbi:MAG: protein kinase [Alphaproteobacteria bacterium]|nr:protein kinase [Alphaproteobacteria bacterium]